MNADAKKQSAAPWSIITSMPFALYLWSLEQKRRLDRYQKQYRAEYLPAWREAQALRRDAMRLRERQEFSREVKMQDQRSRHPITRFGFAVYVVLCMARENERLKMNFANRKRFWCRREKYLAAMRARRSAKKKTATRPNDCAESWHSPGVWNFL